MRTAPPSRDVARASWATRSHRPGWRNPRLLLGVVLVATSVLLGSRLLAAADDSVAVWAVARDLPSGAELHRSDLERRQVRFPDADTADGYLAGADAPPVEATLDRPVSAGELLPRSALAQGARPHLIELPVSVAADDLPATVRQGSVVDVWVTPKAATVGSARPKAAPVLVDVVVVAVPRVSDGLAPESTRQVIVGVPVDAADDLGAALGGMSDGRVVIARKG